MANIVEAFVGDLSLELGNEQFIRPMVIGTNWSKIRIGLHFTINGASTINNAGLLVGVCAGGHDYNSASADLVGGHFGATLFNSTITYTAGTTGYFSSAAPPIGVTKLGASVNTANCTEAQAPQFPAITSGRGLLAVDITKASPPSVRFWSNYSATAADAQTDQTQYGFRLSLENESTINTLCHDHGIATPAYAGTSLWDAVLVYWNKSLPPIEVFEICVLRFQ